MPTLPRRRFLELATAAIAIAPDVPSLASSLLMPEAQAPSSSSPGARGLLVYVDPRLGAEGDGYAQGILTTAKRHPLLVEFAGGRPALHTAMPTPDQLTYNHVLVVALPDDPLLVQAWQREAKIDPVSRSIYAFGFGHLAGSIGYAEADRNPFLHSPAVARAPYECQWITLTGTDRVGVGLAIRAFLGHGLVNGLVAAPGWKRIAPTLLDRDPLAPEFTPSASLPETLGSLRRIALTQVAEDEYRGALADAGVLPRSVWQAKYYAPKQWDIPGQFASFHHYVTGLHRRAYGNAVWAASFTSPGEAAGAAPKIAAGHLRAGVAGVWTGDLPPYAWGIDDMGDGSSTGSLELRVAGDTLLLTALTRPLP